MIARRIRVLAVLPSLESGGVERHAVTIYPSLDRERFDVRLVCIKGRGALFAEARRSGLRVSALDAGDGNIAILRSFFKLVAVMRAFRPEVVTTSGFSADVVGRLAATVTGVPVILTWKHNCGHVDPYGRRERTAELLLRRLTTRYLAVAHGQVAYLTGYLKVPRHKVEVIHNSVAVPARGDDEAVRERVRRSIDVEPANLVIGVIAALRAWKGHETLLRAFRLVLDEEEGARLLVIGDGEERDRLTELARVLGVRRAVRFLGDRRDVDELMSIIDVVVLASHTVECLPFAVLEAMGRGRPAVATAIGGLPELIDPGVTGLLVRPGDERELATALLTIVQAPDRGASLGRAAYRRLIDDFPFDATIQRIENVMETAVTAAATAAR